MAEPAWPDGAFSPYGVTTIHVTIDETNLTATTRRYADEVREAMRWWESGGNGRLAWNVTFVETTPPHLVVTFHDVARLPCSGGDGVGCGGFGSPDVPGIVWLALRDPYSPTLHNAYLQVRQTAKHEIGHAIGFPHSADPADVMAPIGHAVTTVERPITPEDRIYVFAGILLGALLVVTVAYTFLPRRPRNM